MKNYRMYFQSSINKTSTLIAILLFLIPFIVAAGIKINSKLQLTSWQELKQNEREYLEISSCLDSLKQVESAATNGVAYFFLKQGNTCLNSLSFIKKDDVAYLNLLEIEKTLNEQGLENLKIAKEMIEENRLELSNLIWSTKSGFIFLLVVQSLAFGFLFWFFVAGIYQKWLFFKGNN